MNNHETFAESTQAAQDPRTAMALRCGACALKNTPSNVRVIRIRKSLSGVAYANPKNPEFGLLAAPRPLTRKALYLFLHECGHFVLHSDGKRRKRYLEELEAEKWTHARMREAAIAVPRIMSKRAKEYVRYKIEQARQRGARNVDKSATKFAGLSAVTYI